MQAMTDDERVTSVDKIVLDNPNHVKEFLYNIGYSDLRVEQLVDILRYKFTIDEVVINSICERGVVQNEKLDSLRKQF